MSLSIEDDIQALLSWSSQHGSLLLPPIEVYNDAITGLSFRADKNIASGTKLVSAGYATTLSWLNVITTSSEVVKSGHGFSEEFVDFFSQNDPNVIGHFFLIQQYLLKEKSFWWPYIRSLPQPNELSIPTLWSEQDQAFFSGTNVEPALLKRQSLWHFEYEQALAHLSKQSRGWHEYTFGLYKWAAAIFGSRSFRPSLTISPTLFGYKTEDDSSDLVKSHISNDTFSILYPVLDIGNHNATDRVHWSHEDRSFSISNLRDIQSGEQIYNFYGTKSNSELLVGYGFLLENESLDRVNIKLNNLPQEVQECRRTQPSHSLSSKNQPEEEFMYFVSQANSQGQSRLLPCLSQGFFDTVVYLVANARERQVIDNQGDYSPERDQDIFVGKLTRCAHAARHIIKEKVQAELDRLVITDPGPPQNSNQQVATTYRLRTKSLLNRALTQLQAVPSPIILNLATAYSWLRHHLPHIYNKLEEYIAGDQEEPLPLDWTIFVDDWDHTYLLIWIYIILSQHLSDLEFFPASYSVFYEDWLVQVSEKANSDELHAEQGEVDTIDGTTEFVAGLFGHGKDERMRMRNMASHILKIESVRGLLRNRGNEEQQFQEMLCVPGLQCL